MISECGSEVERLAKEFEESRENSSQIEGKLKVIEDAHSLEAARGHDMGAREGSWEDGEFPA